MRLAVNFTNFGPYHLARLRAIGSRLQDEGGQLIAYETAGFERRYPWVTTGGSEPFEWVRLFPESVLEHLDPYECRRSICERLERDRPDAVCAVGYVRSEAIGMMKWAKSRGRPAVLFSESQAIDRPRHWWKEAIKRRRVSQFDAAVVGGERHRDYLVSLGMEPDRITLGYNAVDNAYFAAKTRREREEPGSKAGLPDRPFFLSVSRFVTEKNIPCLLRAYAAYRERAAIEEVWDLVICGDGPDAKEINKQIQRAGLGHAVHLPGFLQVDRLCRWYAHAGAFVLASISEPWGLVVNEAAACGLPLIVSENAGCAATLVPEPGVTGWRFDPRDPGRLAELLCAVSSLCPAARAAMGTSACGLVSKWGPDRFAEGVMQALSIAGASGSRATSSLARPAAKMQGVGS